MAKLFLVPTPIGNLEDMTFRAVKVLNEVDFILAEDTRTSGKLLKHFEINTPMHSHHMHNEHKTVDLILKRLQNGESAALISDAGTPAISDPGFLLTRACVENNIEVDLINIGSGEEISILDLAEKIKKVIGYHGELSFDDSKPDGNPRKFLDSSLINKLGWSPKISLDEGLKLTFNWYQENN